MVTRVLVQAVLIVVATLPVAAGASGTVESSQTDAQPPYLAIGVSGIPSSSIDGVDASASASDAERQVLVGLHRLALGRMVVDLGIDYQYTRFEYTGLASRNRDLHRLQIPFRFWFDQGRFRGYLAPGISTSSNVFKDFFNRGSRDDLYLSGRFEAHRLYNRRDWFAGIAYDRSFGRSTLYPLAGVEFFPSDKLRLRVAYPDSTARYELSARHAISARLFPAGQEWHVVTDNFESEFNYRVKTLRWQLTWSAKLWERLTVDVFGAYDARRQHRLTDAEGARIHANLEDEWRIGISFRVGSAPLMYPNGTGY